MNCKRTHGKTRTVVGRQVTLWIQAAGFRLGFAGTSPHALGRLESDRQEARARAWRGVERRDASRAAGTANAVATEDSTALLTEVKRGRPYEPAASLPPRAPEKRQHLRTRHCWRWQPRTTDRQHGVRPRAGVSAATEGARSRCALRRGRAPRRCPNQKLQVRRGRGPHGSVYTKGSEQANAPLEAASWP